MILPVFINLVHILGLGVDVRDYSSSGPVYNGMEFDIRENVSVEHVEFLVTQEPTEVVSDLVGLPRDMAFAVMSPLNSGVHLVVRELVSEMMGSRPVPSVILAIKIERTSSVLKLSANKTLFPDWQRLAANCTHYVSEVGHGNLVLALVRFQATHPEDRLRILALLKTHLNGTRGTIYSGNFSEAMAHVVRALPNVTIHGPVRTSVRVHAKTGSYGGDISNLVTLVPLLRNYTKNFINTMEGGIGTPVWLRLEPIHSVDPTWPLIKSTVLSEYKNRLAKNLMANYLDVAQARKCVNAINNIEDEELEKLYQPDDRYKNLTHLSIFFSILGSKPEIDLRLLDFDEIFASPQKIHPLYCRIRETLEEGSCRQEFEEELRALPRQVLSAAPRPEPPADCRQLCLADPKCRTAVVASLNPDQGHARCWTLKNSVKYAEFLGEAEYVPGARTYSRLCFS